jgi:hypothetical protein
VTSRVFSKWCIDKFRFRDQKKNTLISLIMLPECNVTIWQFSLAASLFSFLMMFGNILFQLSLLHISAWKRQRNIKLTIHT